MTPTTLRVVKAVADNFGVPVDQVRSRERFASTALARMTALYVLREYRVPTPSFPELGRDLGLDHTTVMSACRRIAKRTTEPRIAEAIEAGRVALLNETPRDTLLAKCNRRTALKRELAELEAEIRAAVGADILGAAE